MLSIQTLRNCNTAAVNKIIHEKIKRGVKRSRKAASSRPQKKKEEKSRVVREKQNDTEKQGEFELGICMGGGLSRFVSSFGPTVGTAGQNTYFPFEQSSHSE